MKQLLKLVPFIALCVFAVYGLLFVNTDVVYFGGPALPVLYFIVVAVFCGYGLGNLFLSLHISNVFIILPVLVLISGDNIAYTVSDLMKDSQIADLITHFITLGFIVPILLKELFLIEIKEPQTTQPNIAV